MLGKAKRYDGFLEHAKVFIKKQKAPKAKLIEWIKRFEELEAEEAELEQLSKDLPKEIDALIASGKMNDETIEELARKRAHLDLLPARQEKVWAAQEALEKELEGASAGVEEALRAANVFYYERQLELAMVELKALGVSEDVARKQALQREDIQAIDPLRAASLCNYCDSIQKARRLLWGFESFEAGFYPYTKDGEKFKKRWIAV
jgi:DNA repair exonuclease SbcCD ATPase subunit